jgi:hypothetical protein
VLRRLAPTGGPPRGLVVGMPGRSAHHHPFRPCLFTPRRPTGPLTRLAVGRQPFVPPIIGAANSFHLPGRAWRPPPSVLHAALAAAGAPVTGHGAQYTGWGPARGDRGAHALLWPSPTHSTPRWRRPARRRSRSGMAPPSAALAPDSPAVDSGRPNGANDPIMPWLWGRVGSSGLWPHGPRPPAGTSGSPETGVAAQRITSWGKASTAMLRSLPSRSMPGPYRGVLTGCSRGSSRSALQSSGSMV